MSVYFKNGKWYFNFMRFGVRKHGLCYECKNRQDALDFEAEERKKITDVERGNSPKIEQIKFFDMIKKYLSYSETNKSSYKHDEMYSKYWKDYFKNDYLQNFKPLMIEEYKKFRLESVKPATVNRELNSLSKMFSIAKQNGYIFENPCHSVKKLRVDNKKIRFLTNDEEKILYKELPNDWFKLAVTFAIMTGMRKSEILGIKWECIDFKSNFINVLKTKNAKARKIPLAPILKSELKKVKRISDYVFTNPETLEPYTDLKDRFKYIVDKCKIQNIVFHDLRHTAATRMVENGADLVVVKEVLGHADINMTLRYAHPVPEMMLKAIMSLNNTSILCKGSESNYTQITHKGVKNEK